MPFLNVTFEVVTPAYAGGADRSKTDGLRPPTLKSLLRFWWRTMHPDLTGTALFDAEAAIFGSAETGQGLRIVPLARSYQPERKGYKPGQDEPLFWLVYGADKHKENQKQPPVLHERVCADGTFSFRLMGSRLTMAQWTEVAQAAWLLSAFGGFGGRSRRGFGSIQVITDLPGLPDVRQCDNSIQLADCLAAGLRCLPQTRFPGVPKHTAFSAHSRLVVGPAKPAWTQALQAAGSIFYKLRRRLGTVYQHTAKGKPVGNDFVRTDGYRHANSAVSGPASAGAAFGLPHNYQFTNSPRKVSYEAYAPGAQKPGRRASPLFIKILKLSSGQYVPMVAWLPADFLPTGFTVEFVNICRAGSLAVPSLVPMPVEVGHLFSPTSIAVPATGGTPGAAPHLFHGYLATVGWTEVRW